MQQYGLTKRQLEVFKYIKNYIAKKKISPSFEEIKVAVGLKSKSGIHQIVLQLETRKWITKLRGKNRSIQILKQ